MHFRPDLNNEERKISARTLPHTYHLKHKLFIRGVKIKKVDKVRFLGVISSIVKSVSYEELIKSWKKLEKVRKSEKKW